MTRNKNNKGQMSFVPDYAQWQDGKTPPSIKFARDVMILLEQDKSIPHDDRVILQEALKMIKNGEMSFSTWVTPQQYLNEWKNG